VKVAVVNSFSFNGRGGNEAGVVITEKLPEEAVMQAVARAAGFSETVYISPAAGAFETRFYTPECEVDLCGHATIAAFFLIVKEGAIRSNKNNMQVLQRTKAGELKVFIEFGEGETVRVMMEQPAAKRLGRIERGMLARLCSVLNIRESRIGMKNQGDATPEIISTGLPDIILPVLDMQTLNSIRPDFAGLANLSKELGVVGVHAFTLETVHPNSTVHCRNFGPAVGIDEESATGTSNGALGYFLQLKGVLKEGKMISEQGFSMGKPSLIYVNVAGDRVIVGGEAVKTGELEVEI